VIAGIARNRRHRKSKSLPLMNPDERGSEKGFALYGEKVLADC
jgi:hypothetical protein